MKKCRIFCSKLNDSDDAREQKSLVAKIAQALVPHTKAEEKVVYDPVAALSAKRAKIDGAEGYTEHALASATLKQLAQADRQHAGIHGQRQGPEGTDRPPCEGRRAQHLGRRCGRISPPSSASR